jgi:hypothetical protein
VTIFAPRWRQRQHEQKDDDKPHYEAIHNSFCKLTLSIAQISGSKQVPT